MTAQNLPYRLMAPGPVPVHPEVLTLLSKPMIHHRTPAFESIFSEVSLKLKKFFKTSEPVLMLTSTGSGAMEASLVNTLSPGDHFLAVVSGKFGERWGKIGKVHGLICHELTIPWGESVTLEAVKAVLEKHPECKAVCFQACETSTASIQPVKEICEYLKPNPNIISIVDGITAVGSMEILTEKWGIDVLVSGSQKAFMLPTGLSMITLSQKAWSFAENSKCSKFYLDLKKERAAFEKNQTQFSSAVTHIVGLNKALDILLGEDNGASSIAKIQLMAKATRSFLKELSIPLLAKYPAPAATAFVFPDNYDGAAFRKRLEDKYNITVIGGQDQLKGRIIRIGHLGYITEEDLFETLQAIGEELLQDQVYSFDKAQLDHALESLKNKIQGKLW